MKAKRLLIVDEYEDGGQVAVYVGERVLVLSMVASSALQAVGRDWTDLAAISSHLDEAVGPPPSGSLEDAARELLEELAELDLIELDGME